MIVRERIVNRRTLLIVVPLVFLGSCAALLPLGTRLADPMTRVPVDALPDARFPIVVVSGDDARVQYLDDVRRVPPLPAGASYLIPPGRDVAIERQLNASHRPAAEGGWRLRVRHLAPERQHIELFWIHDGYSGGAYEATRTSVSPRYRKHTGPGFAFVAAGIALLINAVMWTIVFLVTRVISPT